MGGLDLVLVLMAARAVVTAGPIDEEEREYTKYSKLSYLVNGRRMRCILLPVEYLDLVFFLMVGLDVITSGSVETEYIEV